MDNVTDAAKIYFQDEWEKEKAYAAKESTIANARKVWEFMRANDEDPAEFEKRCVFERFLISFAGWFYNREGPDNFTAMRQCVRRTTDNIWKPIKEAVEKYRIGMGGLVVPDFQFQ